MTETGRTDHSGSHDAKDWMNARRAEIGAPARPTVEQVREVVTVAHLSKRFRGVLAVDDLSFGLQSGTITGFLGPNGAGKTTTLRMLVGLTRPSAGSALVFGRR